VVSKPSISNNYGITLPKIAVGFRIKINYHITRGKRRNDEKIIHSIIYGRHDFNIIRIAGSGKWFWWSISHTTKLSDQSS